MREKKTSELYPCVCRGNETVPEWKYRAVSLVTYAFVLSYGKNGATEGYCYWLKCFFITLESQ